ncbi:MAG: hypothetical protein RI973_63 [Bacteroidota bacterium]|jgi:outer membrane protein
MKLLDSHFSRTILCALAFYFPAHQSSQVQAQEIWSLRKCIEYAREHNLTLKQAQNSVRLAELSEKQNRLSRLPNVSASGAGGSQFGRTIDPTTNSFDNQTITFNSYRLDVGMPLYAGGQINNGIKQSKVDLLAAREDVAAAFNDIALNIANVYLQILMSREQLENAVKRRNLSREQLAQTDKLIENGRLPANDRLDVLARIAADEQSIIQTRNQIEISYLNLKELLQLDPTVEISLEDPPPGIALDTDPDLLSFQEVYAVALGQQPQIRANDLRMMSAEIGVNIAKGALLPTFSIFGGIDTRWSSAARSIGEIRSTLINQTIIWNGVQQQIQIPSQEFIFKEDPYFDQLRDNFGQSIGLSLRVPIYNNGLNSINIERARVGVLNAKVRSDLTRQQLKNDVQQALANARAGRRNWDAASTASEAARIAFENAEKRFQLGSINNLQLLTARNTYDVANTNLIVAKYDYIFRLKIVDFYLGREIKLD